MEAPDERSERDRHSAARAPLSDAVLIKPDGTLLPRGRASVEILSRHAGRNRVREMTPGVLLVQQVGGPTESRERIISFGEIIGDSTVLEVIQGLSANDFQGTLTIATPDARRTLRIDRGMLTSAHSDVASERLGQVMVAMGVLTHDQLAQCMSRLRDGLRLGEAAVLAGYIKPDGLFSMLQAQARGIFEAALLATSGNYLCTVAAEDGESSPLAVHLPLQGLLMQSLQRMDEMAMFRERIPNGAARPALTGTPARLTLDRSLRAVADLSNGSNAILDIARALGLDEFSVTKAVMQLIQMGCLEIRGTQADYERDVRDLVGRLNAVLQRISSVAAQHQAASEQSWTFDAWIGDAQLEMYFGAVPLAHGDISPELTLTALERLGVEAPYPVLKNIATDLVSFAMFAASPSLPAATQEALRRWVNAQVADFGHSARVSAPPVGRTR